MAKLVCPIAAPALLSKASAKEKPRDCEAFVFYKFVGSSLDSNRSVAANLLDQLLLHTSGIFVSDLASASCVVSASTVLQAEFADVGRAGAVKD